MYKGFEREDTWLAEGQLAINSSVKHSYDLCVVHGFYLSNAYFGCFQFSGRAWFFYMKFLCN